MALFAKQRAGSIWDKLQDANWRHRFMRNVLIPWLFILPLLTIHVLVVAVPAVQGIYLSLTDWTGIRPGNFIGLENYRTLLFEDETLWQSPHQQL